jgi:hypothetical protein
MMYVIPAKAGIQRQKPWSRLIALVTSKIVLIITPKGIEKSEGSGYQPPLV